MTKELIIILSLGLIILISLSLAALSKDTENARLRKKRLQEINELKDQIKEDLRCLNLGLQKRESPGAKGDRQLEKL